MSGRCELLALPEWPRDEDGILMDALGACEAIGGCGRDACTFFEEAGEPLRLWASSAGRGRRSRREGNREKQGTGHGLRPPRGALLERTESGAG